MNYQPETPFQITEDNSLVYNLKHTGRYTKGKPEMANDIAINVSFQNQPLRLTLEEKRELQAEIASLICGVLNEKCPVAIPH